jgi:DNA-binding NarL/FixJ family response regulator
VRGALTVRQREVLDLVVAGLSNAEIAEQLVISMTTVKSHVRAILRASGAVNRADAMARLARDPVAQRRVMVTGTGPVARS